MEEWIEAAKRLPKDGATVEVRFGAIEPRVALFKDGRFWQVPGAIDLPVVEWRELPRKGKVIDAEATDGIGLKGQG